MTNQEPDFITLDEIVERINRRKWTLIFCVVLSLVLVILYNRMTTPVYRASAIISFERFSNDNMMEFDFSSASYKDNFIANRIMELKTWTFAQGVYEALPDSIRELFRSLDSKEQDLDSGRSILSRIKHVLGGKEPAPGGLDLEEFTVAEIQGNLSVSQNEGAPNMLSISFDSENAELAQEVANTAVDVLRRRNLTYRREEFASLKDFVDEQLKIVKDKLEAAEDTLSNFKKSNNIASLEDESREILTRITQAEILYNQIQTNKKAAERKLAVIQKKIDEQKQNIRGSTAETSNPMIDKLREQLVTLEVQAANLQVQGYPEDHPRRQELNTEIEKVKQNLATLTMAVIQDQNLKGMIDPLSSIKSYLEESVAIEIEIQGLVAQQGHLHETLQGYNQRLKNLSSKDATLFDLLRNREVNNKLYVSLLEEGEQARLREASEIGTMRVIEPAQRPLIPYKPRKKLNMIIALLAGSVVGLLLMFLKDSLNTVPLTLDEVEKVLNLPVLASIPKIKRKLRVSLNGNTSADGHFYQDAYTSLWQALIRKGINSVMITSATPGEGKSTTAVNLAITAAKLGQNTLLIDGDLRRPSLAKLLEVSDSPGLSNYLSGEIESQDLPMPMDGLKFLSTGTLPKEPAGLWAARELRTLLQGLMKNFDFVVIDTPPALGIPDAVSIASYVDGILFCVQAEQIDKKVLLRTRKILSEASGNLLGVVWNKVDQTTIYGKYKYRKYYQAMSSKP